jgi:hypothetical protein
MEYVVKVKGQEYPNAVSIKSLGGIYNYEETVLKDSEKSFSGEMGVSVYDENLDGNVVYVMFLDGHGNVPVIVGSAEHPRKSKYKKSSKSDGRFSLKEFNGVELSIDKDSNYQIKHVGRRDPDGKILNQAAVDSLIKLFGNGDVELNPYGSTTDLRIKMTKSSKKLEMNAQGNSVVIDSNGIKIKDKFNNEIILQNGNITINAAGDTILNSTGNTTVNSTGDVSVTTSATATFSGDGGTNVGGSGVTNIDGSIVNLAGGGVPVARLGDMAVGVGNLGAPVISNIAQGSPKVTSG